MSMVRGDDRKKTSRATGRVARRHRPRSGGCAWFRNKRRGPWASTQAHILRRPSPSVPALPRTSGRGFSIMKPVSQWTVQVDSQLSHTDEQVIVFLPGRLGIHRPRWRCEAIPRFRGPVSEHHRRRPARQSPRRRLLGVAASKLASAENRSTDARAKHRNRARPGPRATQADRGRVRGDVHYTIRHRRPSAKRSSYIWSINPATYGAR